MNPNSSALLYGLCTSTFPFNLEHETIRNKLLLLHIYCKLETLVTRRPRGVVPFSPLPPFPPPYLVMHSQNIQYYNLNALHDID